MRTMLPALLAASICAGCTSTALQSYTLNQAMAVSEMRCRQAVHALAVVANNNGTLPSFALTGSGTANLTNTVSIDAATLWDAALFGFSKETLTGVGTHNPELQWTLNPVVSEPQLEALDFACLWAVSEAIGGGPPPQGSRPMEILRESTIADVNSCPTEVYVLHAGVMPTSNMQRNSIVVYGNSINILVYDQNGVLTENIDGNAMPAQAVQPLVALAALVGQLRSLHVGGAPAIPLNPDEKAEIQKNVAATVGHPIPRKKEFHFGVDKQLQALAQNHPGWLHVTSKHAVPKNACYREACGDIAVWVTDDGMAGLSEFVLILLDIGTTDPASLALPSPTASVAVRQSGLPAIAPNFHDTITEKWRVCQTLLGPTGCPGGIELIAPPGFTWIPQINTPAPMAAAPPPAAAAALIRPFWIAPGAIPTIVSGTIGHGAEAPEPPIPPTSPRQSY